MRLIQKLAHTLKKKRYAPATQKSYIYWAKRYIRFHKLKHPQDMGAEDITLFLNHLAIKEEVAASTQNQAMCAIVFLYKHVLGREPGEFEGLERAKRARRLPVVLSQSEVTALFAHMPPNAALPLKLMYGAGMRVSEVLGLRIKDVDFEQYAIVLRDPKGGRDRIALLPDSLVDGLHHQIECVRALHQHDRARGHGVVRMPGALEKKYPHQAISLAWQFLFPSSRKLTREDGEAGREPMHPSVLQRAIKKAAGQTGVQKKVSCHTMRHSFATHLLERGTDIRTIQTLLGHKRLQTTMIYTHVTKRPLGIISPLEGLTHDLKRG